MHEPQITVDAVIRMIRAFAENCPESAPVMRDLLRALFHAIPHSWIDPESGLRDYSLSRYKHLASPEYDPLTGQRVLMYDGRPLPAES